MKKAFISAAAVLMAAASLAAAVCIPGCAEKEATSWTLSDTVSASFSDNGKNGYILTVEGSGAMPDYASERETPWYGRAGRVTEIVLDDGITYVGDNTFTGCAYVEYVILPESVTSIGADAFYDDITLYAYSQVTSPDSVRVYTYSEQQPTTGGDYWHLRTDGTPTVWENIKVLFIGNSFTYYNDLPSIFEDIALSLGEVVQVDSIVHGSYTLTSYANPDDVAAPSDDPNMQGDGKTVEEKLSANNDYDVIILQEQSTRPVDNYNAFLSAARTLKQRIDETQTDCDVYLYATWGFPAGLNGTYTTVPALEAALRSAYSDVAKAIGAGVCSVGEAFTYVYEHYRYDEAAGTGIDLYFDDNNDGNRTNDRHPSYAGSYLAACVHAATILGIDPRSVTFTGSLSEETATILQNVAYDIVF